MNGYQLAYALCCCRSCIRRSLYSSDIASHHNGNETAAYVFLAD